VDGVAAEIIPPPPGQYFNDYAGVVSPETVQRLNRTLEAFERDTSSQVLVVVYPKLQSDSSIEDYTVRVAQAWRVGQKGKDNGAVLFVFIQDRKLFLQVGYGLEGALPDALSKQIIETQIKPRFRGGDYAGGLEAGVSAILAAAKGEYRGTGGTAAQRRTQPGGPGIILVFLVLGLLGFSLLTAFARGARPMGSARYGRRRHSSWGGWTMGGGGFSGGGGSWGGGGGFSGGGGRFGGGGAGGSW
jgi:uncharacterized protein